jgi:hypothetical protein
LVWRAVKPSRSGGGQCGATAGILTKICLKVLQNVILVMSEVQKVLENVSTVIYIYIFCSKLARSTFTSPGTVRVKD